MSLRTLFTENLRQLRLQRRLSQQDLAEMAGVSVAYVSLLERGLRSPPICTIEAFARALQVDAVSMLVRQKHKR